MPTKPHDRRAQAQARQGPRAGTAVKAYLDALEQHRPRRGRQRTPDSIKTRLAAIEQQLGDASSLKRLQLVQERRDLEVELAGEVSG